ncbi:MAG: tRNA pseudouridine(54/55) synthase Pus10 [Fervidicoccaceae archaeon]
MRGGPSLVEKTLELLAEGPLCFSCLGRQFASLLRGLTNAERGRALALVAVAELYSKAVSGDEEAREALRRIARSLPIEFGESLRALGIEREEPPGSCRLCGGLMGELRALAERASELLKNSMAETFVVGVRGGALALRLEDELWRRHSITSAESLKNEVKRELGKAIQALTGLTVDFSNPEALILVNLDDWTLELSLNPVRIYGRYLKIGRNISQARWVKRDGSKVYEFSVQDALEPLREYFGGADVVIHASGREDVDARMLGRGRTLVVEIKNPRRARINAEFLTSLVNRRSAWVKFELERKAGKSDVRRVKGSDALKRKVYKALIVASAPLSPETLKSLEEAFRNTVVNQRTPLRVLARRADIVRKKAVYEVKTLQYTRRIFEALIRAEGGLYVKELVSGDGGRTEPSFSSVTGVNMSCVELDVLHVEEPE